MRSFCGKVALVTGGSSGIGRATALAFARDGARVVVANRGVEGGEQTVRSIAGTGGEAIFVRTDVSRADDVEAMVSRAIATYGRIDCAFHNAGTIPRHVPLPEQTEAEWDRVLSTNLKSIWLCMKCEIPHMLRNGGGAIVTNASILGLVGMPGVPAQVAAKHGIVGLTKSVALEYAKSKIRVNAVCPGLIKTPMLDRFTGGDAEVEAQWAAQEPVGRLGRPEEVANAVLWLCSDRASFVTGQALAVDGGWVAQ